MELSKGESLGATAKASKMNTRFEVHRKIEMVYWTTE